MATSLSESFERRESWSDRIELTISPLDDKGLMVDVLLSFRGAKPLADEDLNSKPEWVLMNVQPDVLTIYPYKKGKTKYFQRKYENIDSVCFQKKGPSTFEIPSDADDVYSLLEYLPDVFEKNILDGLGFASQDRFICLALARAEHIREVCVHDGIEEPYVDRGTYFISVKKLKSITKGMRAISDRYRTQARADKRLLADNSLLPLIDPEKYPVRQKVIKPEAVFELVNVGNVGVRIPRSAQKFATAMVSDNVEAIAKSEPKLLFELKADIERVTLRKLIERIEEMLGKSLGENAWQSFFEANPFVLSVAFAVPTISIEGTPYVGNKRVRGDRSKYSDFLCRSMATGNAALIEIKTPDTTLLSPYRVGQKRPSNELVGAITQVLGHRQELEINLPNFQYKDKSLRELNVASTQVVVVIGTTPTEEEDKAAFDSFRHVLKDVAVITFDELLQRLKYIQQSLFTEEKPLPAPPNDVPF